MILTTPTYTQDLVCCMDVWMRCVDVWMRVWVCGDVCDE